MFLYEHLLTIHNRKSVHAASTSRKYKAKLNFWIQLAVIYKSLQYTQQIACLLYFNTILYFILYFILIKLFKSLKIIQKEGTKVSNPPFQSLD